VQRVEEGFSEALFVPARARTSPSRDGVRITRGRIKVAVAPPTDLTSNRADLRRVAFMLALAMDQTKRFQSVDPGHVSEILLNSKTRSEELLVRPDRAVALGKPLEVTGWLVPVLLERRGSPTSTSPGSRPSRGRRSSLAGWRSRAPTGRASSASRGSPGRGLSLPNLLCSGGL